MGRYTKDPGIVKVRKTALEFKSGKMEPFTWDSMLTEKQMAKASLIIQMGIFIGGTGSMTRPKDMEYTCIRMAVLKKDLGMPTCSTVRGRKP